MADVPLSPFLHLVCFQPRPHCPSNSDIYKITAWKHPLVGVVRFRTPLENRKVPAIHFTCVGKPTNWAQTPIVAAVQVTMLIRAFTICRLIVLDFLGILDVGQKR